MSDQHGATGAIRVTDEMVEATLSVWNPSWREFNQSAQDSWLINMRAALTAALALVPPTPGFRAGAEWAAGIIEHGQQTYSTGGGSSLSPRVEGNRDGLAYATAIRTALAALPEGGDGRDLGAALSRANEMLKGAHSAMTHALYNVTDARFNAVIREIELVLASAPPSTQGTAP